MTDLRFPVSLGGRGFLVSRKGGRYGRRSIPLQKAQQDTSDLPGEQSINPEDLWRRSFETWHRGAGQDDFDWVDSDPRRFRSSWGVDPWTQRRLSLLNDTEAKLASTESSIKLAVAGDYLYVADGQTLKYTADILASGAATWTTVTGTPAVAATGLASDGNRVWVSYGNRGIYLTEAGDAAVSLYSSQPTTILGYAKGRVMSSWDTSITNVTSESPSTVSFVGYGGGAHASPNDYLSVQMPAEAIAGDVVLVGIMWSSTATLLPAPDGWTLIDQTTADDGAGAPMCNHALFWKRYEATDAGSVSFSFSADLTSGSGSAVAYRDAYGTDPIDVYAVTAHAAGGLSVNSPSVTTTQQNTTIVDFVGAMGTAGTFAGTTFPATMNDRTATGGGGGGTYVGHFVADRDQSSIGASGTDTWTFPFASDDVVTVKVALVTNRSDPLLTHASSTFTWVGFAEGQGDIYAAGYSGDKSLIYRTQVRADGTALDAPVVAGSLPDGEIVRGIYGYLGILFIGTDQGVRMAVSDANGDLTIGARIDTPGPVRCFEGQENYVWFGLEDFDVSRWSSGTVDGLGRLDLTQQTEQLVPAWASDLMAAASTSTTESVQSIATFQGRRVFSVGSSNGLTRGVYGEKATKVGTGYLDSGLVSYGIADAKIAAYLDVRHRPLVGTLQAYVSADEGTFTSVGTSTTASSLRPATDPMPVGSVRGDTHEVRIRLNRSGSSDEVGPTVTRLTLRSNPAAARGRIIQWPLILTKSQSVVGQEMTVDPAEALAYIEGLLESQELIACRQGSETFNAFLDNYEYVVEHQTDDRRSEQGICTVSLKVPAQ